MPDTLTIPERVAAGAAWLDKNEPSWADRIDLDELYMNRCSDCVLGQVFGDYWDAPLLPLSPRSSEAMDEYDNRAAALGFQFATELRESASPSGRRADYDALAAEWRRVIEARRSGVSE